MARPREFDEAEALDAAIQCFWSRGYEATSVRDLAASMGITGASLYNAFGDKRSLYEKALALYVDTSVADRILRCKGQGPREAIEGFFAEILERSLGDPQRRGCMLVNATLDVLPQEPRFQGIVAGVLRQIESFFLRAVEAGQIEGTITRSVPATDVAQHLLGVLMGIRVLARVRPERALLEGIVRTAFTTFERTEDRSERVSS